MAGSYVAALLEQFVCLCVRQQLRIAANLGMADRSDPWEIRNVVKVLPVQVLSLQGM